MAVLVQQAVVHAPGVDAEGIQLAEVALAELQQTLLQLIEKIRRIPVKDTVHLYVVVFKTVQLTHGDALTVKLTQDRATVAGAQVKGDHVSDF